MLRCSILHCNKNLLRLRMVGRVGAEALARLLAWTMNNLDSLVRRVCFKFVIYSFLFLQARSWSVVVVPRYNHLFAGHENGPSECFLLEGTNGIIVLSDFVRINPSGHGMVY